MFYFVGVPSGNLSVAGSSEMSLFPASGSYKYYLEAQKENFLVIFINFCVQNLISLREVFFFEDRFFLILMTNQMKYLVCDMYSIDPELVRTTRNFEKTRVSKSKIDP